MRLWPLTPGPNAAGRRPPVDPEVLRGSVARIGRSFVSADAYVLPFELASVLLLAALVGSIIIAWPRSGEEDNAHDSLFPGICCVSAALFALACIGVLARRNAIAILMGVELMLNAVNINLIAFWRYLTPDVRWAGLGDVRADRGRGRSRRRSGRSIISVYRNRDSMIAEEMDTLKN